MSLSKGREKKQLVISKPCKPSKQTERQSTWHACYTAAALTGLCRLSMFCQHRIRGHWCFSLMLNLVLGIWLSRWDYNFNLKKTFSVLSHLKSRTAPSDSFLCRWTCQLPSSSYYMSTCYKRKKMQFTKSLNLVAGTRACLEFFSWIAPLIEYQHCD